MPDVDHSCPENAAHRSASDGGRLPERSLHPRHEDRYGGVHSFYAVELSPGPLNLTLDLVDAGDFGGFSLQFEPRVQDHSVVAKGTVAFSLTTGAATFSGGGVSSGLPFGTMSAA